MAICSERVSEVIWWTDSTGVKSYSGTVVHGGSDEGRLWVATHDETGAVNAGASGYKGCEERCRRAAAARDVLMVV